MSDISDTSIVASVVYVYSTILAENFPPPPPALASGIPHVEVM